MDHFTFVAKHISETYTDPITSVCEIGKFDGPATRYSTIVFLRDGLEGVKTFMNATVLRQCLLSNPALILQECGVVCKDADEEDKQLDEIKKLRDEVEALKKENEKQKTDLEIRKVRNKPVSTVGLGVKL